MAKLILFETMPELKKFYLTKEGLDNFKKEYEALKELRIAKARGNVPEIWESEDLNPEYLSFREDVNLLDSKLFELENILKNSKLIKKPLHDKQNIVDFGATILIEVDGQKDEFTLVSSVESNPTLGKISDESPVGRALLGRRVGDEVVISSPIKTIYKIKKIKYN